MQNTRSREASHLVSIGITRTYAPSAVFMFFVKQVWHLLATQCISVDSWTQLYRHRKDCSAGLPRFIEGALHATGIQWSSAFELTFAGRVFHILDDTLQFNDSDWASAATTVKGPAFCKKLHELRSFLRYVHAHGMATDRPKDFGDLTHGWNEKRGVRDSAYVAWLHPGGRSLITGGIWSQAKLHMVFGIVPALCPRCGCAAEDRLHRLWGCPANKPFQEKLFADLLRAEVDTPQAFIEGLPTTTKRCGLFAGNVELSPAVASAIVEYMCEVNFFADQCAAAVKRGAELPNPDPGRAWRQAVARHLDRATPAGAPEV
jgi:hypothetical protein